MTRENSSALLVALGMYFLSQIVVAGAPVTDSSKSSAFAVLPASGIASAFSISGPPTKYYTRDSKVAGKRLSKTLISSVR
jgi:hypothetical protein